jgi:hypothetical protein
MDRRKKTPHKAHRKTHNFLTKIIRKLSFLIKNPKNMFEKNELNDRNIDISL